MIAIYLSPILALIFIVPYFLTRFFLEAEQEVTAIKEMECQNETGAIEWEVINLGNKKFQTKEVK